MKNLERKWKKGKLKYMKYLIPILSEFIINKTLDIKIIKNIYGKNKKALFELQDKMVLI